MVLRFTEHMNTICALCSISALSLSGWLGCGCVGWEVLGLSLCVFATKLTAGSFKQSHFFRLGTCPVPGVSFSPGIAPWCWCSLLPTCELAPSQCPALAAWAACGLDLVVWTWPDQHVGGYQGWRFTEHMTTICALCCISALLYLSGWLGWLGCGWGVAA